MSIVTEAGKLLRKARKARSMRRIAAESNGLVEYEWLRKLAAGQIKNPGAERTEKLVQYLRASA